MPRMRLVLAALLVLQHASALVPSDEVDRSQGRKAERDVTAEGGAPRKPAKRRALPKVLRAPVHAAAAARASLWASRGAVSEALHGRLRLTAFTSEVGESLRPMMQLWKVRACYGVSWIYALLDTVLQSSFEAERGAGAARVVRTAVYYAVFHTFATIAIPALAVHQAVHWSAMALQQLGVDDVKGRRDMLGWAPTALGLAVIPLLPIIDHPLEAALDAAFDAAWPLRAEPSDAPAEPPTRHGTAPHATDDLVGEAESWPVRSEEVVLDEAEASPVVMPMATAEVE